ncbi:MAG: hypothetical protein LBS00_04820, partial [Synergistaceae bacterium]|nr:hypothetical protein [Synergistaceae bacterium]
MRIQQNLPALTAYNALSSQIRSLGKIINRLSTGLRINSAADDAAGLAIAEKTRAQSFGVDQAYRNAQDGISLIQTAEGALNETHGILQRMRELSVQAANDSLTAQDRAYIHLEVGQLKEEIDRISHTTQFNRKKLLDGSSAVHWSSDKLTTNVFVCGGLSGKDAFGQTVTAEGNYRIEITAEPGVGQVQKSSIFGVGEALIPDFNSAPVIEFEKPFGGSDWDGARSLQQTIDGGYIIAGYSDSNDGDVSGNHGWFDYWIVKLDAGGNLQWEKTLGG